MVDRRRQPPYRSPGKGQTEARSKALGDSLCACENLSAVRGHFRLSPNVTPSSQFLMLPSDNSRHFRVDFNAHIMIRHAKACTKRLSEFILSQT